MTPASSTNGIVTWGISGSRVKVTSALDHPMETEVRRYVLNGVRKVVRLHESAWRARSSYPTNKLRRP